MVDGLKKIPHMGAFATARMTKATTRETGGLRQYPI